MRLPWPCRPANEEILYAEKLEVEQNVFRLCPRETRTKDVGNNGDVVFILDGGRHGDGAGTAAHPRALHQTIAEVFVNILRAVGRDVDVLRIEIPQAVDGTFQSADAVSFERRQHFKREGCAVMLGQEIGNFHFFALTGFGI